MNFLEVRLRLPPELRDIWIDGNKIYILVPDAVLMTEKNHLNRLEEVIRWTGAQLHSVSSYNSNVIIGTDRGAVIVLEGNPYPLWTGAPTLVIADNLSKTHKFFILAEKIEQGVITPNLLVPFMVSEDEIKQSKKATSRIFGEITMFPAATSPFKEDIIRLAKRLVSTIDIDQNGFKEIFIASLEENKTQISLIKFEKDEAIVKIEPFVTHVLTYPVALDVGDIDSDMLDEPVLLLRKKDDFFTHYITTAALNLEEELSVSSVILGEVNIKEILQSCTELEEIEITDDMETFLVVGNVDDDNLPEIVILVYIPPLKELWGKIVPLKMSFNGEIKVGKIAVVAPVKNMVSGDIDGDGMKEAVLVTHAGYSILHFDKKMNILKEDYFLPAVMKFFLERKEDFIVAGPIFIESNVFSVIDLADKYIEFLDKFKVVDARRGHNIFAFLIEDDKNRKLIMASALGLKSFDIPQVKNFFIIKDQLFVFADKIYKIKNSKIVPVDEKLTNINHKDGEILLKIRGKNVILREGEILLKGKDDETKFRLDYKLSDVLVLDEGLIIRESNGEIYFIDCVKSRILKSELSNVVGLNFNEGKLQLSFENNWIVDYSLKEVFTT